MPPLLFAMPTLLSTRNTSHVSEDASASQSDCHAALVLQVVNGKEGNGTEQTDGNEEAPQGGGEEEEEEEEASWYLDGTGRKRISALKKLWDLTVTTPAHHLPLLPLLLLLPLPSPVHLPFSFPFLPLLLHLSLGLPNSISHIKLPSVRNFSTSCRSTALSVPSLMILTSS